jgi:tetratricopeptide (TPR) repeat protein
MARFMLIAFSVYFFHGCLQPKGDVRFAIKVKTNQGDPISHAEIRLGNESLGFTDGAGNFKQQIAFPAGEKLRLEIAKASDFNYYAPDFLEFSAAEGKVTDVRYNATLYYVPKPSAKDHKDPEITQENPTNRQEEGKNVVEKEPEQANSNAAGSPDDPNVENNDLADADIPDVSSESSILAAQDTLANPEQQPAVSDAKTIAEAPTQVGDADEKATNDRLADALGRPGQIESPASALPKESPVSLADVDAGAHNQPPATELYPKAAPREASNFIFTIQVTDGKAPVDDAEILIGQEDKGDLRIGCRTNARGRCVVRFASLPQEPVKFIARKSGLITASKVMRVTDKGLLRLAMEHGETIDVFAITRRYGFSSGVQDIEVYIDGKRVGSTDSYGHFSFAYRGNHSDLLDVTLKNHLYLPEEYQTDFVVSGPMSLTRYFTPKQLSPARVAILRAQPAGKADAAGLKAFNNDLDAAIRRAAKNHMFASTAFAEYPLSSLEADLRSNELTLGNILSSGWQQSDIKGKLDAVVLPTISVGDRPILEISVVDSTGHTIGAAKEDLENMTDGTAIEHSLASTARKIIEAFPFEGAVLSKTGELAQINIGTGSGRGLTIGDEFAIYGNQSARKGDRTENAKIAICTVEKIDDQVSDCRISNLAPRAVVERGDQTIMNRRNVRPTATPGSPEASIRVVSRAADGKQAAVSQANVYYNGEWLGSSDKTGKVYYDRKAVSGAGLLKVIKHGHGIYSKAIDLAKSNKLSVDLPFESAYIRVETIPPGASVSVDGQLIGKTPLVQATPVPSGFVKIEVDGPGNYKKFSQVMELEQGTLDLTGQRAIKLERDFKQEVAKLLDAGKTDEAISRLEEIGESHSDYLTARHELGEIYLTFKGDPQRAAATFAQVTSNPAVHDFNDKRFIGSHIDEGISVFMVGENLVKKDKQSALAHYEKAIEILDRVKPFIRFVQKEQYGRALHNLNYHKALAQHRIWEQSADRGKLEGVIKDWQEYIESSEQEKSQSPDEANMVENARVYFQQAKASISTQSVPL